jgi:hypothetical protein
VTLKHHAALLDSYYSLKVQLDRAKEGPHVVNSSR